MSYASWQFIALPPHKTIAKGKWFFGTDVVAEIKQERPTFRDFVFYERRLFKLARKRWSLDDAAERYDEYGAVDDWPFSVVDHKLINWIEENISEEIVVSYRWPDPTVGVWFSNIDDATMFKLRFV